MTAPGLEHELALGALRGALAAVEARPELAGAALARLLGLPSVAAPPAPEAEPEARPRRTKPRRSPKRERSSPDRVAEARELVARLVEAHGSIARAAAALDERPNVLGRWARGCSPRSLARLRAAVARLDAADDQGEDDATDDEGDATDDEGDADRAEVPAEPPFRRPA